MNIQHLIIGCTAFNLEIMMTRTSKTLSSFLLAGSKLFAVSCFMAFSAVGQAAILSWHDEPIMGSNVFLPGNGSMIVTVNGSDVTIPDSNTLPSQAIFKIHPFLSGDPDCGTHLCDPNVFAWAASSVNVDPDSTYSYVGNWAFLGNGSNAAYNFDFPVNVWGATGTLTIAELYSSVGKFWLEDEGLWKYTETWTGTAGNDAGALISFTRGFEVVVPEPATLALLALGLAGLGFSRRRKQA